MLSRFTERQLPLVSFVVPISPAHLLAFQVLHLVLILASYYPPISCEELLYGTRIICKEPIT